MIGRSPNEKSLKSIGRLGDDWESIGRGLGEDWESVGRALGEMTFGDFWRLLSPGVKSPGGPFKLICDF